MLIFGKCLDNEKRRKRKKSTREFIYCLISCEWEAQLSEVFSLKHQWAWQCWKLVMNGRIPKPPTLRDTTISCIDEKDDARKSMIGEQD